MAGEHWTEMTLGDFVTLQRGHDLPDQNRRAGKIPILGSFGITGWHDEAKAPGPGVTVGRSGASFGVVSYSPVDYWPLNTALYVIDFHGNDERFAYYFLRNFDFKPHNSGSAQPSLNRNFIHPLPVRVPLLPEQKVIADILGSLDDKMELNRRMNRALEGMARVIFNAWFVDFEPVKAKAARATRFPGMPQEVFDQLPDQFTETELGPVPKGWDFAPIGKLVDVVGGGTPSTKNPDYWEGGDNAFCTPKDMSGLTAPVLLDTERHITQAGVDKISSGQLPVGTVILSSRAPIGYLALAATSLSINQGIIAMLTGGIPNTYVLLWTEANMDVIKSRAGGSTFAEISKRNFRPIPALRPDDQTLRAFGEIAQPLFEMITSNERESRVLARMRDALLPKLISGEIRAPGNEGVNHGG